MSMRFGLVVVSIVLVGGTATAGGTWSDNVAYRRSSGTSLKVTEPDGFKVTITTAEGDKTGTIPELFQLPDQDAFVKVTVTATDGTAWSKKIEVRAGNQTELAVGFKADDSKPSAKKGRSFVGKFLNGGNGCEKKAYAATIKAEFLRSSDGTSAATLQVDSGKTIQSEIPSGSYDIRIYLWSGSDWNYVLTNKYDVATDGWVLGFGCRGGSKSPQLVGG